MSGFDAGWLELREPFDTAARSETLTAAFAAALPPRPRLIDLGGGSGANIRYLMPRLRRPQEWWLIDNDARLLDAVPAAMGRFAAARGWTLRAAAGALRLDLPDGPVRVRRRRLDLARELDAVPFADTDAVTASALLDLTSAAWLDGLAARVAAARVPLLAGLSYDGRLVWSPADDDDVRVQTLFDRHQRRDKGFGPALGPGAAAHLATALGAYGFEVRLERSDWRVGADDRAMLRAMVAGTAGAAREAELGETDAIDAWASRRRAVADGGRLELRVGHRDLVALPAHRADGWIREARSDREAAMGAPLPERDRLEVEAEATGVGRGVAQSAMAEEATPCQPAPPARSRRRGRSSPTTV